MKKYILIAVIAIMTVISATSCGNNDMANNNGSDTGVSGNGVVNDAKRAIEDGIHDMKNGTGGDVSNDVYSDDGFASDNIGTHTDMSYDASGVTNSSSINY